jgi:hypothetical protein
MTGGDFSDERGEGKVSEESFEETAVWGFGIVRGTKIGPFRRRWRLRTLKTRLIIA